MATVRDKLWIFGVRAHQDDIYLCRARQRRHPLNWSRITPAEGAMLLDVPNLAMVNCDGVPAPFSHDAYGYAVVIDHGDGRQTLYGHCSYVVAQVGDQVRTGETVALVGSTGNSTGPHLHFEIRENGVCVDPLLYLPVNESAGSSK